MQKVERQLESLHVSVGPALLPPRHADDSSGLRSPSSQCARIHDIHEALISRVDATIARQRRMRLKCRLRPRDGAPTRRQQRTSHVTLGHEQGERGGEKASVDVADTSVKKSVGHGTCHRPARKIAKRGMHCRRAFYAMQYV